MYIYFKLGGRDLCVFRTAGPGLGNLLFPWARGIIAARKYNALPVWPTWPQLKIGPYLRGERDKRDYTDTFVASDDYCRGLDKCKCIYSLRKYGVNEELLKTDGYDKDSIIIFSGRDGLFQPIINDHQLVRNELEKIVKPKHFSFRSSDFKNTISVHVRMGDFVEYNENYSGTETNMKIPLEWYINIIRQLRINNTVKVIVFSDGSDMELKPLLDMPNVERVDFGSAIADMLALSYSNIMISSNSTFSMWASYLGRMPVVRPNKVSLYSDNEGGEEVFLRVGADLPKCFIDRLVAEQKI